jgi:hypothetical protein
VVIPLLVFPFVIGIWVLVLSSIGWISKVEEQGFLFRPILGRETYYDYSVFRLPVKEESSGWRRVLLPFAGSVFLKLRRNICVFLRDADLDRQFLSAVSRAHDNRHAAVPANKERSPTA